MTAPSLIGTTENIGKLTNELAVISDRVEELKTQMDDKGASMTDTSPLVKIKQALTNLKSEVKELEVLIRSQSLPSPPPPPP